MGDEAKEGKAKGSCLGKLAVLFVFVGLAGLGTGVAFMVQPQDTSDISGVGPAAAGRPSRDLKAVLKASLDQGYELPLKEDEINRYLRDTLRKEQTGPLAEHVKIQDVMVRLEEGRAEVVIVRDVAGYPVTISMYLRVHQEVRPDGSEATQIFRNGGPFHESLPRPAVGGRFGRLPVPEGFLLLTLEAFEKLASVYRTPDGRTYSKTPEKELDFIEEMARIRIEDGKLVLLPTAPGSALPPIR